MSGWVSKNMLAALARRPADLRSRGWREEGGFWINPRTLRKWSLEAAVDIEKLRSKFDHRPTHARRQPEATA